MLDSQSKDAGANPVTTTFIWASEELAKKNFELVKERLKAGEDSEFIKLTIGYRPRCSLTW